MLDLRPVLIALLSAALCLTATADEGPVRLTLRSGETIEAQLLRYENGVFTLRSGTTTRTVAVAQVARLEFVAADMEPAPDPVTRDLLRARLETLRKPEPGTRRAVMASLAALGPRVRPLIEHLLDPGSVPRPTALPAPPLRASIAGQIDALAGPQFDRREQAAHALVTVGRPALPQLFEASRGHASAEVRARATALLERIEPPVLPRTQLASVRPELALMLARIGDPRSIPALRSLLGSDDVPTALAADLALRAIRGDGPPLTTRGAKAWSTWLAEHPPTPLQRGTTTIAPTRSLGPVQVLSRLAGTSLRAELGGTMRLEMESRYQARIDATSPRRVTRSDGAAQMTVTVDGKRTEMKLPTPDGPTTVELSETPAPEPKAGEVRFDELGLDTLGLLLIHLLPGGEYRSEPRPVDPGILRACSRFAGYREGALARGEARYLGQRGAERHFRVWLELDGPLQRGPAGDAVHQPMHRWIRVGLVLAADGAPRRIEVDRATVMWLPKETRSENGVERVTRWMPMRDLRSTRITVTRTAR